MTHGNKLRLIAVPMLALMAAIGGCSTGADRPEVASAGGDSQPNAGAAAPVDDAELGRKFARCMRAEGVDMPDPGPGGVAGAPGFPAGDDAAGKAMAAALEKCREFLPDGGEPQKASAEDIAKAREYAKCARRNGAPGFPDPDPETGNFKVSPELAKPGALPDLSGKCQQFGAGVTPALEVG